MKVDKQPVQQPTTGSKVQSVTPSFLGQQIRKESAKFEMGGCFLENVDFEFRGRLETVQKHYFGSFGQQLKKREIFVFGGVWVEEL
ncbi:hypothetical protein AKJ51_02850 [candidate division MSBL1 archaeon SCGC-AAA382A20]|uniref:Uncharacterized protein n=1 Tax=candidate division MSBL1 archaeon SCGC-AAA382A20 TaxID=1698280 RepID=A0A133VK23_9EURY|nr:hypothetical protein AKJ51_02850 [candidate division MSBL1 archaeon SCGC-AAA382A20]